MPELAEFELLRPRLERLAYRMLGSRADADDVLQEAYLRWSGVDPQGVRSAEALLVTIVTRLCIDRRREIETRKEHYVGPWLPEPVVESTNPPDRAALVADSVSMALMVVLERLSPAERAAYLLRQVFSFDYSEIGQVLEKSETNCRQLVSRAEKHVLEGRPRFEPDRQELARIRDTFLAACASGDVDGLVQMLTTDAVSVSDGGGKATAALRPILGARNVARFCVGIYKKTPAGARVEEIWVGGEPGLAVFENERLVTLFTLDIVAGRVQACYAIRNPEKLARIDWR
jgi:RNA polymerase sigma-70 factor (ECF subfamily)